MKACLLEKQMAVETHPLAWMDVADPKPGDDEVLIRVEACGVCRTDLHVIEGELPLRRSPLIPGHQIVGEVAACGKDVRGVAAGGRVGVAWLHRTCGKCRFCRSGRENLCERAEFTGWTVDGGFAEFVTAPAAFTYSIPKELSAAQAAPLLCAGIIGYRALRLTGLGDRSVGWRGARLGLYGFGAAGHIAIQLARSRGVEVYVCTRDRERHQTLARELGAAWVGGADERPPALLDAAIIFAPAGELVLPALQSLDKGGVLVLGGIHMSPIPPLDYALLYQERVIRSVTNNTREDGKEFFAESAAAAIATHVQAYPLSEANEALIALKHDAVRGAAVLLPS